MGTFRLGRARQVVFVEFGSHSRSNRTVDGSREWGGHPSLTCSCCDTFATTKFALLFSPVGAAPLSHSVFFCVGQSPFPFCFRVTSSPKTMHALVAVFQKSRLFNSRTERHLRDQEKTYGIEKKLKEKTHYEEVSSM